MKLAAVAFYGLAAGLLAVGLRELLTGFEENRCSMTYMFEYPEYRVSTQLIIALKAFQRSAYQPSVRYIRCAV